LVPESLVGPVAPLVFPPVVCVVGPVALPVVVLRLFGHSLSALVLVLAVLRFWFRWAAWLAG